jgi:crotonobetainyl-CoA:carnitine CoA-transferase CaiB-like acyl-CoA transferase
VCTAITPFGLTGPWRDFADSEVVVTALTGVGYYIPGTVEDPAEEPPLLPGAHITSCVAGLQAAGATLVAINGLDTQGAGQQVDVSEQACLADTLRMHFSTYEYAGNDVDRDAGRRPVGTRPPYWLCNDGFVWGLPGPAADEHGWLNLVDAMGNPEWAQDLALLDQAYRRAHWNEIRARIEEWARTVSKHEIAAKLQAAHIPTLPVHEVADLFRNEQLSFRGSIVPLPGMPGAMVPASPYRFDGTALTPTSPAPRLGEHTSEVLLEAGFDSETVRWLFQAGVV